MGLKKQLQRQESGGLVRVLMNLLEVNTSLIRRIIKSPALKIQSMKIGKLYEDECCSCLY